MNAGDANGQLAAEFITYIGSVRQLSPHTLTAYRHDLKKLLTGIGDAPCADTSAATVRRLIAADSRARPASLARRLAAWRAFFDYLIAGDAMRENPARAVLPPKTKPSLPKSLTPDEMSALLATTNDTWQQQRDQALMELFYSSALRLSELARLNLNDVDLSGGYVHIQRGKGGRGRVAPVGATARNALKLWLKARQKNLRPSPQPALFISRRGARLSGRAIQHTLAQQAQQQGMPRRVSPHILRHSCASHFLQSSGDLRATQELLGHRNIVTTQIYTRLDFQHLATIYDRAHPRAQTRTGNEEPATRRPTTPPRD